MNIIVHRQLKIHERGSYRIYHENIGLRKSPEQDHSEACLLPLGQEVAAPIASYDVQEIGTSIWPLEKQLRHRDSRLIRVTAGFSIN